MAPYARSPNPYRLHGWVVGYFFFTTRPYPYTGLAQPGYQPQYYGLTSTSVFIARLPDSSYDRTVLSWTENLTCYEHPYLGLWFRSKDPCPPQSKVPQQSFPPLYSGIVRNLDFDHLRWRWTDGHQLSEYTSNIGRTLLTQHKQLCRPIYAKWPGHLPVNFSRDWRGVWHKRRACKEAAFMWSIWHNAVAVQSWRARVTPGIDVTCPCCNHGVEESPAHRFYFYPQAQEIWAYAQSILIHLLNDVSKSASHTRFDFQQCVFGTQIPNHYHAVCTIWSSLRGSVLWIMWISRNSKVFSQFNWALEFSYQTIWDSLLDSGRAAQLRTQMGARLNPDRTDVIWKKFDNAWLTSPTLASRVDNRIIWIKQGPPCLLSY